jgi:hypothetical protein
MIIHVLLSVAAALALRGGTAEQGGAHSGQDADTRDGIWYLNEMLDRFGEFAFQTNASVLQRHADEDLRLRQALSTVNESVGAEALNLSVISNNETAEEEQMVLSELFKFIGTMKTVVGKVPMTGSGHACADIQCGEHASCSRTTDGAECICDEGYEGDGTSCAAPSLFTPQRLLRDGMQGRSSKVADMSVNVFYGHQLVVAFRDMSNKDVGKVMIGDFTPGHIHWSPPEKITDGKAFDPVAVGLPTNRIIIAYRDSDREAALFLRAGELDASGMRGTPKHITWSAPVELARMQAHRAALLPLGLDKAVAFYSDYRAATKDEAERHFCAASLAQVGHLGAISELGTFHFLEYAATRLTAKLLTPTSFIIAYRGTKAVDDMNPELIHRQEASAMYGELVDTELSFDPNPIDLEPETTNIWDRGLSLLGPSTFGYAYETGKDQATHLAVIHVDADHQMKVMSRTKLSEGFSPFVRMVDVPYSIDDPHTLTYFERDKKNVASICMVNLTGGNLTDCEETVWMDREISSVASASLGNGRTLFAFADEEGIPFYHVIGLSQK